MLQAKWEHGATLCGRLSGSVTYVASSDPHITFFRHRFSPQAPQVRASLNNCCITDINMGSIITQYEQELIQPMRNLRMMQELGTSVLRQQSEGKLNGKHFTLKHPANCCFILLI